MHNEIITLEVCAGSLQSAIAAQQGGAERIEICSGLDMGGLTPSAGLIEAACSLEGIATHVLIRPREGDFLYSREEKDLMLRDIVKAHELGADGIVVGALTADGQIDTPFIKECVMAANGMSVTFHRAFDFSDNPYSALEDIISTGANRLLTSGRASGAEQGMTMIRELVHRAAGRISIMPGGGITVSNAAYIVFQTGVTEIHASARKPVQSLMQYRREGISTGKNGNNEYLTYETDADLVRKIVRVINA